MKWLRFGIFEELSPLGILATGIAIGATTPVLKKGLRGAAFIVAKGVISTVDQLRETTHKLAEEWSDIVSEVKSEREQVNVMTQELKGALSE